MTVRSASRMVQADGGNAPLSKATRSCRHVKMTRDEVSFGPLPGTWTWLCVSGWRCASCGSGFAIKAVVTRAARKIGARLL